MTINKDNVLRVSAQLRGVFKSELTFLERLELCGIWAMLECVEKGLSDAQIAEMFNTMKARMLAQAPTLRQSVEVAKEIKRQIQ